MTQQLCTLTPYCAPQPDWQGTIYETMDTDFANRDAECSVVLLALTIGEKAVDDLKRLNARDFYYDDCRFVFQEVLYMVDAGHPTGDKAALKSWFERKEVTERAMAAKLTDWFRDEFNPYLKIIEMFLEPATVASLQPCASHLAFYIREMRRCRVARGIRYLAADLDEMINKRPHDPLDVLAYFDGQYQKLREVAATLEGKRNGEEKEIQNNQEQKAGNGKTQGGRQAKSKAG